MYLGQGDLLEKECRGQRSQVLLYNLCYMIEFFVYCNVRSICVSQGDRGGQGERGMKGVKGDMGDSGIPGQTVSKLTSTLTEHL